VTTSRPIVAVVPFGAKGRDRRAGAIGRQLARRLVERFSDHPGLDVRPVFLVAMPETKEDAGYLVFGSTPDAPLAAGYAETLGAAYALTGLYRDDDAGRRLAVTLVGVKERAPIAQTELAVTEGALHRTEPELARWLARALNAAKPSADGPELATEEGYVAYLEGLDEEVNATLLGASDEAASLAARERAFSRYVDAIRADPFADRPEERVLVLAAESVERGDDERAIAALEDTITVKPRSWRANFVLGELLRQRGEAARAIVALEHANSMKPLRDSDVLALAELYIGEQAPGQAASHLRRIGSASESYARAQELLGLLALQKGDHAGARTHFERSAAAGRAAARIHLARVLIAADERDAAAAELGRVLDANDDAEAVAQARRLRLGLERPDLEADLERAGRAALSQSTGPIEEHRAALERVLAFDADLWEAHFGIGLLERRRESYAAAADSFRRALALAGDQPDVMHELGVALLSLGTKTEALALLDRAAALRPADPAYLADAGFAHLRAGDLGAARERLHLASTIDGEDPLTRAYLAELDRAERGAGKAN
jgi:Tfp pilus assembly protein PilF/TolB-like protein